MNRCFARLKRESGNASLQSVLILGAAVAITLGFLALWSSSIRPTLHDAAASHLVLVEAGATSPPGTGLLAEPLVETEDPEPVPNPLDPDDLARQERRFVRARGENEPRLADGDHRAQLTGQLSKRDDASLKTLERDGRNELAKRVQSGRSR